MPWRRRLAVLGSVALGLLCTAPRTAAAGAAAPPWAPLWRQEDGQVDGIDWLAQLCVVEGVGLAPGSWPQPSARRGPSEAMARLDVRRRLTEQVQRLQVVGSGAEGQARALMQRDSQLAQRVLAQLDGYQVRAATFFSDGGVSLRAELPLAPLSALLLAALGRRLDPVPAGDPPPLPAAPEAAGASGLVVDAQRLGLTPRLAWQIVEAGGRLVFDARQVRGESSALWGTAAVAHDLNVAMRQPRVGPRPYLVRASALGSNDALIVEAITPALLAILGPRLEEGRLVLVL